MFCLLKIVGIETERYGESAADHQRSVFVICLGLSHGSCVVVMLYVDQGQRLT